MYSLIRSYTTTIRRSLSNLASLNPRTAFVFHSWITSMTDAVDMII